jgi:hypothetical protein
MLKFGFKYDLNKVLLIKILIKSGQNDQNWSLRTGFCDISDLFWVVAGGS